jgi:hypothetical protein
LLLPRGCSSVLAHQLQLLPVLDCAWRQELRQVSSLQQQLAALIGNDGSTRRLSGLPAGKQQAGQRAKRLVNTTNRLANLSQDQRPVALAYFSLLMRSCSELSN